MKECFQLQRHSDSLVYTFDKTERPDNLSGYKRRDADLWITYRRNIGWCAYNEETYEAEGIPWDAIGKHQNPDFPPEGIWVSRKGEKSYVYTLVFIRQ